MSIQRFSRIGASLVFVILISGCASGSRGTVSRDGQCGWSPGSCMYDGAYEPGERDYAEQEARRLNQAQVQRLQRNFVK